MHHLTRKSKAFALAAAVLPVLALAGCGGSSSSKPPSASQSLSSWISTFKQAVASGSCSQLKTAYPDANNCQQVIAGYKSATVTGSAQFGTGAVVDFNGTSAYGPQGVLHQLTMFLTLGPTGKWQGIDSQWFGHPTVGTRPGNMAAFKATADKSYAAVASRNCAGAYKYSITSASQSDYCSGLTSSPVVSVLAANPKPRTVALGGTADVQFFGYFVTLPKPLAAQFQHGKTKGYATLAVVKVPAGVRTSNPYVVEAEQPGPPVS